MKRHDNVVLGENATFSTDSEITGVNNNIMVCAAPGAGKTVSVVEPSLLATYETSPIVTVTKRRIVEKYAPMFEKRGYRVLDLNFVDPEKSNVSYDPLHYIRNHADVSFLSESVIMANPRKENSTADPYWDDNAILLLTAITLLELETSKNPCYANVMEMCSNLAIEDYGDSIRTNLDKQFDKLGRTSPQSHALACWRVFSTLPIKTAACVMSAMRSSIDKVFTPELNCMMRKTNYLDFPDLAKEKTVLFITTSAVNPALSRFVNLFYGDAFKQLFEFAEKQPDGRLPRPVRVIADDFATGSQIHDFAEYSSIFREKGVSVTLLIQSDSQLEAMYGAYNATTIRNNCDTYVFMGCNDLTTARTISVRADLPLEDVLYMPVGKEIVFRRGIKPIITERCNIFADPEYKKITTAYNAKVKRKKQSQSINERWQNAGNRVVVE